MDSRTQLTHTSYHDQTELPRLLRANYHFLPASHNIALWEALLLVLSDSDTLLSLCSEVSESDNSDVHISGPSRISRAFCYRW